MTGTLDQTTAVFTRSGRTQDLQQRLSAFMQEHIYPNEAEFARQVDTGNRWEHVQLIEDLKPLAREAGLWNLFLPRESDPEGQFGAGLSSLDYAPLCEIMGRVWWAPEIFNCNAPDTGNMEVLTRYGTKEQQETWLTPLLNGEIRSCFAMTEPEVASSDATNIESSITRDGDEYVLNGRKWWTSGAGDPRCKVVIFMGKTDPNAERHLQQSMILVPLDAKGVTVKRMLTVFGYDDAPHGHAEVIFENVRVPITSMLLGEGRGFEIAQGRLGPGRIHHCMRLIGQAERALELMVARAAERVAFGKPLAAHQHIHELIAESRIEIDQARLLTLQAAHMMDTVGNKAARSQIAAIKVVAPNVALKVIDRAIQVFGGAGVSGDTPLAQMYAQARTLRLADGPDIVHLETVAKMELKRQGVDTRRKGNGA
ncbi:acyl-CoA dehydrogenase (plasmid) [Deinococcus psychrotolerans]|uniref:Acyl-CoA dehydrogenase n=1 Tax=Deinococcus psychrotolerans TaxID=2489213 RepID=A0A3G8YS86_9DEIO|nr:acyl-CoA dehydrogenase family protein [Deinococcus psychrotolerans]AZI44611.1 acyl-CoA dehydrogenase [Deinococcus psychrotolerans]